MVLDRGPLGIELAAEPAHVEQSKSEGDERVQPRSSLTPMPTIEAVKFEQWVSDNNPDHNLSYSKGWWDTVEFILFLKDQLEIEDVSVVGTFTLRTPPPTEELLSPIVCLKTEDFTAW